MKLHTAYLKAFRSGELAAMLGGENDEHLNDLVDRVPVMDDEDYRLAARCVWDGYETGLLGGEPMSETQIDIHYD